MSAWGLAGLAFLGVMLSYTVVWWIQRRTKNAGIIDSIWAYSLAGVAVFYGLLANGDPLARFLIALGGGVWGIRLGAYLWQRNAGHEEDARYRQLRNEWGEQADSRMLRFFTIQAVAAIFLSLSFLIPAVRDTALSTWQVLAAASIWLIAVLGESMADSQLRAFVSDPANRGKVCDRGLWRYSRHPNYFFECCHWLAYVPLAIGTAGFWLTLLPPFFMAWLLIKVSGIPMLEAHLAKSRPDYAQYQKTTNRLIPWPPRHLEEK